MYTRADYPETLWQALATTTFLTRLGYRSDEIFVVFFEDSTFVHLKADGKLGVLRMGDAEFPPEEMKAKLLELTYTFWNTGGKMTVEEKNEVFNSSHASRYSADTLAAMMIQGFDRWMKP